MKKNTKQRIGLWSVSCVIAITIAAIAATPVVAQSKPSPPSASEGRKMVVSLQGTKPQIQPDGVSPATPFIVAACPTQQICIDQPLVVTNGNPTPVRTVANVGAVNFDVECRDGDGNMVGEGLTLIPNSFQSGMSCPANAAVMVVNCGNPPCVVGWVP